MTRTALLFTLLALLTAALFVADLAVGSVYVSPGEIWGALTGKAGDPALQDIVLKIRLLKAVTAFAAGAADEYGRRWVSPSVPEYQVQDGEIAWPEESVVYQKNTLADWGLE